MKSKVLLAVVWIAVAAAIYFVVRTLLKTNKAIKETAKGSELPTVTAPTK